MRFPRPTHGFLRTFTAALAALALAACGEDDAGANDAYVPLPRDGDVVPDSATTRDAAPPDDDAALGDAGAPDAAPALDAALADAEPADAAPPPLDQGLPSDEVRFSLMISNDVPESIWVQLNGLDGQPAWLTVLGPEGRIWFDERCEIEDCFDPTGVCGAAEPRLRDITGGHATGQIDLYWDGVTSVVDGDCERRVNAPPGSYQARFCWSLQADVDEDDSRDPTFGVGGTLIEPVCATVDFTYPGPADVVWTVHGG